MPITEADEAATSKAIALQNYREMYAMYKRGEETMGVLAMYEQAALGMGWTWDELETAVMQIKG